jgi:molybdopterin/thiamine biosynthesis adenylyltransferase
MTTLFSRVALSKLQRTDGVIIRQKVDAAKTRIESLNPLVTIQAVSHDTLGDPESLDALVQSVDLVCVTDWHREGLVRHATCS